MRSSEFWTLMDDEFGPAYSRTVYRDHVLDGLGDRTAEQAVIDRVPLRTVWQALCESMAVPPSRRWGRDPGKDRRTRDGAG